MPGAHLEYVREREEEGEKVMDIFIPLAIMIATAVGVITYRLVKIECLIEDIYDLYFRTVDKKEEEGL